MIAIGLWDKYIPNEKYPNFLSILKIREFKLFKSLKIIKKVRIAIELIKRIFGVKYPLYE